MYAVLLILALLVVYVITRDKRETIIFPAVVGDVSDPLLEGQTEQHSEHFEAEMIDTPNIPNTSDTSTYDLDPEFTSSRERMGACTGKKGRSRVAYTRDESPLDDDIALTSTGRQMKPQIGSPLDIIYNELGLDNPPPTADDCQYTNGVNWYKEPCDS